MAAVALLVSPHNALAGESKRLPGAGNALGIPVDGNDRIRLEDGRVMACKVEDQKDGYVLKFATFVTPKLPKSRILEWRKFADYDSTPRTEEEKVYLSKGQVRFGGRWMAKEAAEKLAKGELEAARKVREEDDFRSVWANRWKEETDHFDIEANVTRDALEHYKAMMEIFYDYFVKAFKIQLTQRGKTQKLKVYLYGRRDEFVKAAEVDMPGRGDKVGGYFASGGSGREKLVFFDAPDSRDLTTQILFHELSHFVIHLAEPQVITSRWVNEGFAEYFAGSLFDGKRFTPGPVMDSRLLNFQEMIRTNQVLSMEKLMKSANPYDEGKEEKPIEFEGECYAQSWAIVHYLMEGKNQRYRPGFISFLSKFLDVKGKMTAIRASEQKFMDYEECKAQLLRCTGFKDLDAILNETKEYVTGLPLRGSLEYARRGQNTYYNRKDPEAAKKDFDEAKTRGMNDAENCLQVGLVFLTIPERQQDAQEMLRRSLELDPLNPRPRYFLTRWLEPTEALKELETCVQVAPDFAPALSAYALSIYQNRLRDRDRAGDAEEKALVRQAIAMAERALQLDASEEGYSTLASLCLTIGEFEKARAAQKAAVELSPDNMNYVWRLAECHALLGQSEEFAKLLRRIEMLFRRAGRPAAGETAREGASYTKEEIEDQMAILVRRMAEKCMMWEKYKEAALALKSWYEKRSPKTEDDWVFYATVLSMGGDKPGAAEVAVRGLGTFPGSEMLKQYAKDATAEGPK
jgi:tetratricopeptide (TPR) repeat protein